MHKVFRKEIKYPISILDFALIRGYLESFVKPDPHSGEDGYRVRSLYFDSGGDQDLLDSLAGQMEKRKIRLRFYPPDTGYIRLEYKCKSGTDGIKRSIRLSLGDAERMMKGDYTPLAEMQEPLALELYSRMMLEGYRPKSVVEYHRQAYVYPVGNTRINFDSAVAASYVTQCETTEQEYDSTDSYAALFLIALWEYYEHTGNTKYIIDHYEEIAAILGAIEATTDEDGLTYAKPDYLVKYLMDNTEVYKGLSSALKLYESVLLPGFGKETSEYISIKQKISYLKQIKNRQEQAIKTILWNEEEQRYEVGICIKGEALTFEGWSDFYPYAVGQLFPIIFGVIEADSEQARNLYRTFSEYYAWQEMAHYEKGESNFYWGLTAYCGALMRDEEKVRAYLEHYKVKVNPNYEYPAYNADVAWVVLASAEMARFYQEQMDKIDPWGIVSL